MTDAELLRRWAMDREISGGGHALAMALERRIKALDEDLSIAREQGAVACGRAQSWKNLCEHWKELAEARGAALALRKEAEAAKARTDLDAAACEKVREVLVRCHGILRHKNIEPPMQPGVQQRLESDCADVIELLADLKFQRGRKEML